MLIDSMCDPVRFVTQKLPAVNLRRGRGRYCLLTGILLAGLAVASLAGFRVNLTPSMPVGFYRVVPAPSAVYQRGEAVAVCPPVDAPFLPRGFCPLGMQPLLKEIAGVPGDEVTVTAAGVRVNGGPPLPMSAPLKEDSAGGPLPQVFGKRRIEGYWLYGADSPRSFDRRYFGAVPAAALVGVARPVPLLQKMGDGR